MSATRRALVRNSRSSSVGAAEELHEQRARDVEALGHLRRHLGVERVALAGDSLQPAGHQPRRDDEQRQQDQREQRDLPRQVEHRGEHDRDADDVADDVGQRAGERLLRTEHVVVDPADQRTGLGAGEERDRHALDVLEDLRAHVVDQALADPRGEPSAAERLAASTTASSATTPASSSVRPTRCVPDPPVDDRPEDQRVDRADDRIDHDQHQEPHELPRYGAAKRTIRRTVPGGSSARRPSCHGETTSRCACRRAGRSSTLKYLRGLNAIRPRTLPTPSPNLQFSTCFSTKSG